MKILQYYKIFLIENSLEDTALNKKLFYNSFAKGIEAVKTISENNSNPHKKVKELNALGAEYLLFKQTGK